MSAFETLQTRHQELLKMEHEKEEVLTEAQKFIDDARQAGGTIGPPQEREQLRANMRYWAGYVYDHTTPNFYPTTDLRPYSGPALSAMNWAPWIIAGGILLAAISIALGAGGLATVQLLNPTSTPVAGLIGSPTLAAGIATTTMPTATALPTLALIVTATPITELSPTAPPTQDVTGIVAQLTSPADGQEISPRVKLAGTFSNLQPGWSIHVLLQPLSQAGRYYPLEQFVTVQAGSPSGDWALDAAFGEGAELEKAEQYNISLVVALDDKTRAELARAPRSGFDALPSGVIPFPQVTTVRRGAYEAINETRVVYSLLIHEQSTIELFTARPDGSDGRQLTRTANIYELQPGVSPSGKQIVFVGSEQDATGVTVSSLWLMDSDGQNRTLLATQPGVIYERPVWSPDGRYFAYDANIPDDTGDTSNNLFIYDTTTGESTRLTQGPPHKRFPSWTREGDALIFSQVSDNSHTQGLFRLTIASREISTFFDTSAEETQPAVSPDGLRVAFVSFPEDTPESNRDVYVLELATMEATRVTTHPALDWYPWWGPDSGDVYFISFRQTGNPALWATSKDDSTAQLIVPIVSFNSYYVGLMDAFVPIANP